MTFEEFKQSVQKQKEPPSGISPVLQALWHAGKKNWERAHEIVQEVESADGSWVHAYLHREEGDQSNADYWYRRSGRTRPQVTLEQEWESIVRALLV